MNVVLPQMRRDQWTPQKISFWTYYSWFVVYSGSAQNLPPCPIIKSSSWYLEEKWNSHKNSGLWWALQIISLPNPVTSHWWL